MTSCSICNHAFTERPIYTWTFRPRSLGKVLVLDLPSLRGRIELGCRCCHWCAWRFTRSA